MEIGGRDENVDGSSKTKVLEFRAGICEECGFAGSEVDAGGVLAKVEN